MDCLHKYSSMKWKIRFDAVDSFGNKSREHFLFYDYWEYVFGKINILF